MGERKGLNKYIPPNFDPMKIPRIRKPKNQQRKFRSMVPFRIRCNTCGNYMSEATKINCREEEVIGEAYLGVIKVHRFYFKCSNCCVEIILKTDPKKSNYVVESGATCVYDKHEEEEQAEESEDTMSSLEKRTLVSKREIDVMATLDEMKSTKARRLSVSVDSMLEALSRRDKEEEVAKEEDAALIKSIRFGKQRRIVEEEVDEEKKKKRRMEATDVKKPKTKKLACTITLKKKKRRMEATDVKKPKTKKLACTITLKKKKKKTTSLGLASLCHNYGTDEED